MLSLAYLPLANLMWLINELKAEWLFMKKLATKVKKKIIKKKKGKIMPSQPVIDKITAALTPLYTDADFAGVSDMNVAVTSVPTVPAPVVEQVDVVKPA